MLRQLMDGEVSSRGLSRRVLEGVAVWQVLQSGR
jgi:hypothetical protein